jgi:EAL domain-containing protein (putative c-di-GMP-specific phosphodiesterase class I)
MPMEQMLFSFRDGECGQQIQGVLEAVRQHLGMDVGFVSEFVRGRRFFRHADAAAPGSPVVVGNSDPLEESYCHYVAQGRMPQLLNDAAQDPIAASMPVTRTLPVGAHLSVPIRLVDGSIYGTLCCFSFLPDSSLNARDLDILRMCAGIMGGLIQRASEARGDYEAKWSRITSVIENRSITMVYQPIYRLVDDRLDGVEALARFTHEPVRPPDKWFADAAAVGLGAELEFLALEEALGALPALSPSVSLSLNLSPEAILTERFQETFAGKPATRLIVELTEHAATDNYPALNAALAPHRKRGLRLAIDDVGAGHASFRHVLDLRPDLIKLDMSLTRNIDSDLARRALAASVTRFSREMGCEVVAEGVETAAELVALRDLDVTKVQGYFTGRPIPLGQATALAGRGDFGKLLVAAS